VTLFFSRGIYKLSELVAYRCHLILQIVLFVSFLIWLRCWRDVFLSRFSLTNIFENVFMLITTHLHKNFSRFCIYPDQSCQVGSRRIQIISVGSLLGVVGILSVGFWSSDPPETAYNPIESCQIVPDSDEIRIGIRLKGLLDLVILLILFLLQMSYFEIEKDLHKYCNCR
jgi:hypothetical protein